MSSLKSNVFTMMYLTWNRAIDITHDIEAYKNIAIVLHSYENTTVI